MNMTLCAAACLVGCVPLANIGAQTPSRHDIYLPAAARICLRLGNGNVMIDGHFASVEISGDELQHSIKLEDRAAGAASSKSSCGVI